MDQIEAQAPLLFGVWNKQCFRGPPTFELATPPRLNARQCAAFFFEFGVSSLPKFQAPELFAAGLGNMTHPLLSNPPRGSLIRSRTHAHGASELPQRGDQEKKTAAARPNCLLLCLFRRPPAPSASCASRALAHAN